MKRICYIAGLGLFLAACAGEPVSTAEPEEKKALQENQCRVDSDCGSEGQICVKPDAADYGFCLG